MYSPTTPRSLIIYRYFRDNGIHILIALRNGEETLKLKQEPCLLAIAHVGASELYEIHIHTKLNVDQTSELRQGLHPFATTHADADDLKISNSAMSSTNGDMIKQPKDFVFSVIVPTKDGPWHSKLGHPGTTMFRRMLPILTRHVVCPNDANKVGDCVTCL
jgi:hypothetical protein